MIYIYIYQYGKTPLYWAALEGCTNIVGVLLQAGADHSVKNNVSTATTTILYIYYSISSVWYLLICDYYYHTTTTFHARGAVFVMLLLILDDFGRDW